MIKIEIDEKSLKNISDTLEGISPKKANSVLNKGFSQAATLIERKLRLNITGRLLNTRSGHLKRSIGSIVRTEDGLPVAHIGSGVRQGKPLEYAGIHEAGGTIRPKIKQFLTIPLRAAQTATGQTNFSAKDVLNGDTKYSGSFVAKGIIFGITQSGSTLLKSGRFRKGGIVPLFALKRSVTIRPSHYLTITRDETMKDATAELVKAVNEALEPKGKQ